MAAAGRRGKRERRPQWAEVACGGRPMVAAGSGARRGGTVGRGERARGGGRLVGVVGVARDLFIGREGKGRGGSGGGGRWWPASSRTSFNGGRAGGVARSDVGRWRVAWWGATGGAEGRRKWWW